MCDFFLSEYCYTDKSSAQKRDTCFGKTSRKIRIPPALPIPAAPFLHITPFTAASTAVK
jgi:hypothetical protein